MPRFSFVAKKPSGEVVTGTLSAGDSDSVHQNLKDKGLIVESIDEETEPKSLSDYLPFLKPGVSSKELLVFTKYFCILVKAGIPVLKSLKIVEDQTANPTFKTILAKITEDVTGGSSLFMAFDAHPHVFPPNYRNLIRIGEESGALHEVLVRLHEALNKEMKLKGKVQGAMVYPAVISFVAITVVAFLLIGIIPKFVKIFKSSGKDLPLITRIVVGSSNMLVDYWYLLPVVIGGGLFLFKLFYSTRSGKITVHSILLKVPAVGPMLLRYNVASFATNLDMLSRGGASLTNSLKLSIKSLTNEAMKVRLEAVVGNVEAGQPVAKALEEADIMPTLVLQMISVGEETGALNEMLETITEFYEEEIDSAVAKVLSLIEPMFILFLGVVVGTIVIAMYLPIFAMAQTTSGHK